MSSYDIQGNIVCTKFEFFETLTMIPCIQYCPYPFIFVNENIQNICVNAICGEIKHSFI
jgi:hypothetical protein